MDAAQANIESLAREICASVPHYVDCHGVARERLPASETAKSQIPTIHQHAHDHKTDCYTLIFPLYVAGRSKAVLGMGNWVIKELHHIASHFRIRNAEMLARILEEEKPVSPWEVYAMLGGYAFIA
jgi:hypothetical protein